MLQQITFMHSRITYKTHERVNFPAYKLPHGNYEEADGLVFMDDLLLDDRNVDRDTLGQRRLLTPHEYQGMFKLKKAADSLLGLIKNPGFYIDSSGSFFYYEKTKFAPLRYYKIKRVDRKSVASILWFYEVDSSFVVPRPPPGDMMWAGILFLYDAPWILYEYSREKQKDTRRKI